MNPLRFTTEYVVTPDVLAQAQAVDAALRHDGFELDQYRWRTDRLPAGGTDDGAVDLLGHRLVAGVAPSVRSAVEPSDLDAHVRMIHEARRRADWVLVSVHAHDFDVAKDEPPHFLREYAHACVEAGADAVLGHGPHLLRGVEFHRGCPIFYSLGNFVFQLDLFDRQPAEAYERLGLDPFASFPGDLYERRARGRTFGGLGADRGVWESVVASCRLHRDAAPEVRVHPVELNVTGQPAARGTPRLATGDQAREILEELQRLSASFGTRVELDGETALLTPG